MLSGEATNTNFIVFGLNSRSTALEKATSDTETDFHHVEKHHENV